MVITLNHRGWVYGIDIEHYQPEVRPVPCQDHDDPDYSDPGCGAEVDFSVWAIFSDGGSLDDIPDGDDFTTALLDHLADLRSSL